MALFLKFARQVTWVESEWVNRLVHGPAFLVLVLPTWGGPGRFILGACSAWDPGRCCCGVAVGGVQNCGYGRLWLALMDGRAVPSTEGTRSRVCSVRVVEQQLTGSEKLVERGLAVCTGDLARRAGVRL